MSRTTVPATTAPSSPAVRSDAPQTAVGALREAFGVDFSLLDADSGTLLHQGAEQLQLDAPSLVTLARTVADREAPELLAVDGPLLVLAAPLLILAVPLRDADQRLVALAAFVTNDRDEEALTDAADRLGLDADHLLAWAACREPWTPQGLVRLAESVLARQRAEARVSVKQEEIRLLNQHLTLAYDEVSRTYEDISVLYRITENLRVSSSVEQVARVVLDRLIEVMPARGLALQFATVPRAADGIDDVTDELAPPTLLVAGESRLDAERVARLVDILGVQHRSDPLVVNSNVTDEDDWPFPDISELIVVPVASGEQVLGWLVATDHVDGAEFGTHEAGLLRSVALILGVHRENLELYERQVRMVAARMAAEETHRRKLEVAHQAGRAEIATGVLHNVGNVLNSVNISATIVAETVRKSRVSSLARAAQLLKKYQDAPGRFFAEDERGRLLPSYLAELSDTLLAEQQTSLEEIRSLIDHLEHIKSIVATQQAYAGVSAEKEALALDSLVEDAERLSVFSFEQLGIEVTHEFDVLPTVMVEKQKLLQLLVNLLRNAKQALNDRFGEPRRIALRTRRLPPQAEGESERWAIEVADNGIGISRENLVRIFGHGFSTRDDGHGFGLHSAANAAAEMGGSLRAESDGPGRGATFTLELPLIPAE